MKKRKTAPDLRDEVFGEIVITEQEHRRQIDRYSRGKKRSLSVVEYIADIPELSKEHREMSRCGEYLIFKEWIETGFLNLAGGFSCKKHLLCQCCAIRRDSKQIRDYSLKIEQVLRDNPALVPVLITLTVKNGRELAATYDHLEYGKKQLQLRRRQSLSLKCGTRGRSSDSIMKYVAGAVGTYEFKRGKNSGLWHPHIHQVAFLEPVFEYTPQVETGWVRDENGKWCRVPRVYNVPLEFRTRLRKEYFDITGDSYMVDVRRIDIDTSDLDAGDISDFTTGEESVDQLKLVKALCEVFKYALKYNEMTVEDQVHAYTVLKGRRLIYSYGCLRGVKVDDNLVDKARSDLETGPYRYRLYKSYAYGYGFLNFLTDEEFDDIQETASLKGRLANLRRREQRLNDLRHSVVLKGASRVFEGEDRLITQADMDEFVEQQSMEVPF